MKKGSNILRSCAALLLSLFIITSCTNNFEDWNQKEGEPNEGQINEGNYKMWGFFPQIQNYAYPAQENAYQMGQNLISDPYGRYLSISNAGWKANYSTFNASDGWLESPFGDTNSKVIGAWVQIKKMSEGKGLLFALAQIGRVTAMQRLSDLQGPVPYTGAGSGALFVTYNSQEEAYKAMIEDLDAAIDVLHKYKEESTMMARFDQVYKGDVSKWVKYANSLKLRMAMRIVYAPGAEATAKQWAKEAVTHPGGLIELNSENATNAFPKNPIWTIMNWGDSRACADIIAYMNGYEDPRLPAYFTPNTAENVVVKDKDIYLGIRSGVDLELYTTTRMSAYSASSYIKYKYNNAPTLWMPAAEVAFLKAEAALRGWEGFTKTAEEYYKEGIELSFAQWEVAGASDYVVNSTLKPAGIVDPTPGISAPPISTITIAWDETDNFETKLERLMTQKWIAMYPLGQEAWSEQRRTGYPRFYPVLLNANSDKTLTTRLASRIPFSPKERDNNVTNYNKAIELLGGPDAYGTRLWWDNKPNKPN